jgi:hypothetical protein
MNQEKYLKKYKRCLYEYVDASGSFDLSEEGEDMEMPQGGAPDGGMPMGGEQDTMVADPNAMGGDPNAMGGDPNAMGGGPNAMGGAPEGGVEGFNPEGGDDMSMPEMGGGMDTMQSDDEVIDVDDLTKSQEDAEKKIDAMNSKFEKLMGAVETLIKQNAQREKEAAEAERRAAEQQAKLESELEKRIPTPQQRMTMRSTKSAPYAMTPNEYMNNYAPDNYSDADDNNGADDMQYQITKDDVDRFTDYNSIAKELDVAHQGLHDILGF